MNVECRVLKIEQDGKVLYYPQVLCKFMFFFGKWENIRNENESFVSLLDSFFGDDDIKYKMVSKGRESESEASDDINLYIKRLINKKTVIKKVSFDILNK